MTHTPGPWTVTEQDEDGHAVIEGEGGASCVAYTAGWYRDDGRNDGPDNARLIAAAPDLLEVLRLIAETPCNHGAHPLCPRLLARDAVAKAEGRQ